MKQAIYFMGFVWGVMALGAEHSKGVDRAKLEARAAKDDAAAQFELAYALYWADGMKRDLKASAKWAQRAAKAGHTKAQFLHGVQLLLDHGVEGDSRAGFDFLIQTHPKLEQAAKAGDAQAHYFTAQLYFYGYHSANGFRQDIKLTRQHMTAAAEKGNNNAAFWLGMAILGEASPLKGDTPKMAAQWLRRAATAGHPNAAHMMGDLYLTDLLGKSDPKQAARWLKQASEKGLAGSQHLYANLLASKALGEPDKAAALKWFQRAANQGYWLSQQLLCRMYFTGKDVKQDFEQASLWLTLLARQRDLSESSVKFQRELSAQLTPAQTLNVLRRANDFKAVPTPVTHNESMGLFGCDPLTILFIREDLLDRLAGEGDIEAAFVLGNEKLARGRQLAARQQVLLKRAAAATSEAEAKALLAAAETNRLNANKLYIAARKLFKIPAEKNDVAAQHLLAAIYINGLGTPVDAAQAVKWFERAAQQKDVEAMTILARWYVTGNHVKQNQPRAMELYQTLADLGDAPGQDNLAIMYIDGIAVEQDLAKAGKLLLQAAQQGLPAAQSHLGQFYLHGYARKGVNRTEALKWYTLAARQGHTQAQMAVGMAHHFGDGIHKKNSAKSYEWLLIAGNSLQRDFQQARRNASPLEWLKDLRDFEAKLLQNKRIVAAAISGKEIEAAGENARKFVAINLYRPGQAAPADLKALQAKANRGDAEAQFQLGLLHLKGLDAPPQFVQAYKWFTLAMEADHALAEGERDALSGIMKNSQIIEAKKLARKFKPVKD